MLTPIETSYMGYRFRSRLEARWAVFFNTLGVKFEYEKEGFKLGEAGWYLPDFWIPSWDVFIEIKPEPPTKNECKKAYSLAVDSNKPVLLICGNPWPGEYFLYRVYPFEKVIIGEEEFEVVPFRFDEDGCVVIGFLDECGYEYSFASCRECKGVCLVANDEDFGWLKIGQHTEQCDGERDPIPAIGGIGTVGTALQSARSARFEHNERNY